ncbi:DUF3048 domain-containing protein [Salipaludibacillus sp. CF4.18]|uniref:DUF3048 domain-containing protein n=1 Tax=Salipaludibacillus sp. CF4.18 TaxID=3373081 RepID=UPI003EE7DFE3
MKVLYSCLAIIFVLILTACNNEEDSSEVAETKDAEEEVEETEKETNSEPENTEIEPSNTFPLTGEPTEESTDHRAFGVMIENSTSSRPHSGLYQADVVYELLTEGQITRLLAIFHSDQPEKIGNVRSAREYFVHLNNGYDAIYSSAGGSPGAFDLIKREQVPYISGLDYDGQYFMRTSDRSAPHNMYTTYEDLVDAANDLGLTVEDREPPELPFFNEADSVKADGTAQGLDISYNSVNDVRFDYDKETNSYIRSVGGNRVDDLETGEPVASKNVFIVASAHQVLDNQGRRSIDIESGGEAFLVQGGEFIEAEWRNVDGLILPFKDDEALSFLPGQTWINFVDGGIENKVSFDE